MQRNSLWVAVALALAAPLAQADDLKALREEVAQLKKSYEDRIAALEKRLADAEAGPHHVFKLSIYVNSMKNTIISQALSKT